MATSHQAQVSDPEYHNWVRCVLGLKYTQEGLYPFIDNEAREFHKNLTANISPRLGLYCNQCTINTILPSHTPGTCPLRKSNSSGTKKKNCICTNVNRRPCPAGICGRLYDGIMSAHRYRDPAWWNSDMKQWNVSPWEVAKTFLPSTGGYTQISQASDTDCSGLLNIAINMEDITNRHGITSAPGVFEKCRTARNVILHSSSQKLSDSDRDDFIQTMVDVLECTQALKTDQAAQLAVTKLQQVKSDLYIVTTADIQEAENKAYEKKKAEFKQRLIQMVQERFVSTPVAENMPDMISVEKLFVKPYFQIMEVNVFSGNKAKHQRANSVKDLFFKGDNLCKRIYVTGDAGSGKTTFCRQIAHSWTHIHSETGKCDSDSVCSEYVEVMKHFDFVFYLPLRSFCHMYRVEEMLQSHYFPHKEDFLSKVLSKESCLVVLDGLDEWGPPESYQQPASGTFGLPDFGDIFPYTALVTTRPWKLETLRLNSTEIDLQVKLGGIHWEQAEELSQKITDCLNKATNSEKKSSEFIEQLNESGLIDFKQIPILLKQLVILWHRRNTFGNSLGEIYSEMIDLILEQSQAKNKGMSLSEPQGSKEESKNVELPSCFESTEYCPDHVGILYSLAKVAFKTLFNKDQTCALVFRHNAKVHGFSKFDMELLLKTGILSQHIDFSCDVKKHKYLSFLHKSIQEFLAAVYICISDSDACLKQVFEVCQSWDIVLQMKAVFTFISGWNGDIADKIPKFIQSVLDNVPPENALIAFDYLSQSVQKFMIECLQESSKLNKLPYWKTEIIHINTMRNLKYVKHLIQRNDIKCVFANLFWKTVSESELQELLSDLTFCPSLHTVIMYLNDHSSQESTTQLCKALLYGRTLTYFIFALRYLEKGNAQMFCENVLNYLRNDDLTALRKLSFINENLFYQSNSDMQKTLQQIGTAVSLNYLWLKGIGCSDHGEKCTCILDLTKQAKLKELDISNLHIGQVKLDSSQLTSCAVGSLPAGTQASFLHSLHSASSLQILSLRDILDENTDLVASLLQCLTHLTELNLFRINFNERKICLSTEATHIESIILARVNISLESLIYFLKTIPATQHKVRVKVLTYGEMDALKKYVEENRQTHVVISFNIFDDLSFHTIPDKQADT